jgi:hypothetical protein
VILLCRVVSERGGEVLSDCVREEVRHCQIV